MVDQVATAHDFGRRDPAPPGLRPGAAPPHERLLQLRGLLHDHLDPLRLPDRLRRGDEQRRSGRHQHRLAVRRHHGAVVGLAMAEVCSSYPTAGGLYYWSAKLGGKNGPAWSWFTGWFNLLGQIAVTAGIDGGLAFFASAFLNIWFNYTLDAPHILLVYAVALFLHGLLNTFGVRLVAFLNNISVWWHLLGVLVIVVVLFVKAPHPPVRRLHLRPLRRTTRAQPSASPTHLRPGHRPAARAVHVHGLRRLGTHDRGDAQRRGGRSARHRDVDHRVARSPAGSC